MSPKVSDVWRWRTAVKACRPMMHQVRAVRNPCEPDGVLADYRRAPDLSSERERGVPWCAFKRPWRTNEFYEQAANDARRIRRASRVAKRPKRAGIVPLVRTGGPGPTAYVLLGLVRACVAATNGPRLSAGTSFCTRSRPLRAVPYRCGGGIPSFEAGARFRANNDAGVLGPEIHEPKKPVGRGPYCSGVRRRRRVRPGQHSHAVFGLPQG